MLIYHWYARFDKHSILITLIDKDLELFNWMLPHAQSSHTQSNHPTPCYPYHGATDITWGLVVVRVGSSSNACLPQLRITAHALCRCVKGRSWRHWAAATVSATRIGVKSDEPLSTWNSSEGVETRSKPCSARFAPQHSEWEALKTPLLYTIRRDMVVPRKVKGLSWRRALKPIT